MYDIKCVLGDFNTKVKRQNIFKLTTWNMSLHDISNANKFKVANFVTSETLSWVEYSHKATYIFTSDRLTHNQIYHVLIEEDQHTSKTGV
jgi:hypothetical protein